MLLAGSPVFTLTMTGTCLAAECGPVGPVSSSAASRMRARTVLGRLRRWSFQIKKRMSSLCSTCGSVSCGRRKAMWQYSYASLGALHAGIELHVCPVRLGSGSTCDIFDGKGLQRLRFIRLHRILHSAAGVHALQLTFSLALPRKREEARHGGCEASLCCVGCAGMSKPDRPRFGVAASNDGGKKVDRLRSDEVLVWKCCGRRVASSSKPYFRRVKCTIVRHLGKSGNVFWIYRHYHFLSRCSASCMPRFYSSH